MPSLNWVREGDRLFKAVEKELEAIKAGCRAYDESYMPRFTFVIGTKRHLKVIQLLHRVL